MRIIYYTQLEREQLLLQIFFNSNSFTSPVLLLLYVPSMIECDLSILPVNWIAYLLLYFWLNLTTSPSSIPKILYLPWASSPDPVIFPSSNINSMYLVIFLLFKLISPLNMIFSTWGAGDFGVFPLFPLIDCFVSSGKALAELLFLVSSIVSLSSFIVS